MDIDNARAHLDLLLDKLDPLLENHYSEADTRVKFIDPLLTSLLGWAEVPHIKREEQYFDDADKRCIDYIVSLKEPILVVEAKKNLLDFEIPDLGKIRYKLNGVIQDWPNAWAAIKQCRRYCDDIGARYALVTNGRQYIAFKATNEPGKWTNGYALVWRSPQDLRQRFTLFYECLSRETIAQGKLTELAWEQEEEPQRHRPRALVGPTQGLGGGFRNELHDVLHSAFSQLLLDTIEPTKEFLEECYCTSETIFKYGKHLNSILVDETPLFRAPISPVRAGSKKDPFDKTVKAMVQTRPTSPLIVVMGGPGVGKTTFLQWYFQTYLDKKVQEKSVVLTCDFRTIECGPEQVRARTLELTVEQLKEVTRSQTGSYAQMKEIFRDQIEAAVAGELKPWVSDAEELEKRISNMIVQLKADDMKNLKLTVNYLKARCDRQTIVILDNMDQKSEELQSKLYQVAQELVFSTKLIVILALRESTYLGLTRSPQFNAFSPVDFHVKVQPAGMIIDRRLEYLGKLLGDDDHVITGVSEIPLTVKGMRKFLRLMSASLVSPRADTRVIECIEALSNGNTREQLRTVYAFLVSGQTKISTYLDHQQDRIPYHEFLDSIIYEDRRIFDERQGQRFMNVFALPASHGASHFTALRILALYRSLGQEGSLAPNDYISVSAIFDVFEPQGGPRSAIEQEVRRMAQFGLLMPESQDPTLFRIEENFALTRCGLFYLNTLNAEFSYVSAMAADTTITDHATAAHIVSILRSNLHMPKIPVNARVELCAEFVAYLRDAEERELSKGVLAQHKLFSGLRFVPAMEESLDYVTARVAAS